MLSRFLTCRERFRLYAVEGVKTVEEFNHRIEYGQMWHTCEEALAANKPWEPVLLAYAQGLARQYPVQSEQVDHWYNVCKVQFPLYVQYWAKQRDVTERTPIYQEQTFKVAVRLPSGRVVYLRGKWDSVDVIGAGKPAAVYVQENKTKGDIREVQLRRQLTFDLQTMIYVVAFIEHLKQLARKPASLIGRPVGGVRYNVVRRPLSGGKGSIVRHKPSKSNPEGEGKADFYRRVAQYIIDEPQTFFMRWKIEVSAADVEKFKRECLYPLLEFVCRWYEWVSASSKTRLNPFTSQYPETDPQFIHWRHPFGVMNVLDEGGCTDVDEYLATGSTVGLRKVDTLFNELNSPTP
jgi:hypothetical protein